MTPEIEEDEDDAPDTDAQFMHDLLEGGILVLLLGLLALGMWITHIPHF